MSQQVIRATTEKSDIVNLMQNITTVSEDIVTLIFKL